MGSEETVWLLGIDGSEALGTLEEIITALGDAKEAIAGFVAAAADLSSLDAAFANISSAITDTSTSATDLDEAMAQMSATVAEDTAIIDSLNETVANLEAQLAALTTEADSAAESAGNLGLSFQDIQKGISSVGDNVSGFMGGIGEMLGGVGDFADFSLHGRPQAADVCPDGRTGWRRTHRTGCNRRADPGCVCYPHAFHKSSFR